MDWLGVWRAHPEEERLQAWEAWLAWLREERSPAEPVVRDRLARALRFRPQTLERMPRGRLAVLLDERAGEVMDPPLWQMLLVRHYFSAHGELLVAFLDALGVPHDGRGGLKGPPDLAAVGEARLGDAVARVRDGFGRERADRYFRVLLLQDPEAWGPLARFLDARLEAGDAEGPPAGGAADERRVALDEFTTLDRVVIDAVVATAVGAEGALGREEARDLVETVAALNAGRKRSWFHVGFLEGLLEPPGRMPEREGLDGERRAWALAGLMAAAARRDDRKALEGLLDGHRELFREAAERPGGPGAALANVALEALLEAGRFEEGCRLLRGQAGESRLALGELAYQWATRLWREKQVGEARLLLETLQGVLGRFRGEEAWRRDLGLRVGRRLAQCLQALGELEEARARFEALLAQEARAGRRRAEVLADLGLVAAGFRDLAEVRLPEGEGDRQALRAALERGRERFEQAVAEAGAEAPNAAYALAVLAYLRWWEEDREAQAQAARQAVALAVQAMGGSPSAEEYRRLGLLGQAQLMEAVLEASTLDPGVAAGLRAHWERIPASAGRFPLADLERLLQYAGLLGAETAARIAESVARHHGAAAAEHLAGLPVEALVASEELRGGMRRWAADPSLPHDLRYRLWQGLAEAGRMTGGGLLEEALDALEGLAAEHDDLARRLLAWLEDEDRASCWEPEERLWVQLRLARQLGEDGRCGALVQRLFYRLRDRPHEGAVELLEQARDWGLDPGLLDALAASLPRSEEEAPAAPADSRPLRILFVGGNEIQARYDEAVRRRLAERHPHIQVEFEHTGWRSNWGEDLERLVRKARVSDAVVLMPMMRTMLGRGLRARLQVPWVSCPGTGRDAIVRSILRAAAFARGGPAETA